MSAPYTAPATLIIAATVSPAVGKLHSGEPSPAFTAKNPPVFPPVAKTTLPTTSGVA